MQKILKLYFSCVFIFMQIVKMLIQETLLLKDPII